MSYDPKINPGALPAAAIKKSNSAATNMPVTTATPPVAADTEDPNSISNFRRRTRGSVGAMADEYSKKYGATIGSELSATSSNNALQNMKGKTGSQLKEDREAQIGKPITQLGAAGTNYDLTTNFLKTTDRVYDELDRQHNSGAVIPDYGAAMTRIKGIIQQDPKVKAMMDNPTFKAKFKDNISVLAQHYIDLRNERAAAGITPGKPNQLPQWGSEKKNDKILVK